MVPDLPTVERRRHTVTIIVRLLIAIYGAWCLFGLAAAASSCAESIVNMPVNTGLALQQLVQTSVSIIPLLGLLLAFILFERKLIRWIVPIPARELACPKCGYSLKGIKSPICPECGANLGG